MQSDALQSLPHKGYLELSQIIGRPAVTAEQAAQNKLTGHGPKRPRNAIQALVPVSKSTWWAGCGTKFPAPIRIGRRTFWRADEIAKLIELGSWQGGAK